MQTFNTCFLFHYPFDVLYIDTQNERTTTQLVSITNPYHLIRAWAKNPRIHWNKERINLTLPQATNLNPWRAMQFLDIWRPLSPYRHLILWYHKTLRYSQKTRKAYTTYCLKLHNRTYGGGMIKRITPSDKRNNNSVTLMTCFDCRHVC